MINDTIDILFDVCGPCHVFTVPWHAAASRRPYNILTGVEIHELLRVLRYLFVSFFVSRRNTSTSVTRKLHTIDIARPVSHWPQQSGSVYYFIYLLCTFCSVQRFKSEPETVHTNDEHYRRLNGGV